jgi:hypothetical protein
MIRRFWLLTAFFSPLIFFAGPAHAQKAGAAAATAAPHVAASHARPVTNAPVVRSHARASSSKTLHPKPAANDFVFGSGTSFGFGNSDIRDQDLGIKALIDPATEWRLYERHKFRHNGGFASGFYLLDGGYDEPAAAPGDADQVSQPTDEQAQEDQEQDNGQRQETYAEAAPESAPEQLPDVGQFVLVLRNGSQIQAVAFTRRDDRIVYITTDGLRRSLAVADLDSDSTVRVNQERGTPLQFPL